LIAEFQAYFFTCNAEGWRRFCEELGIDAAKLTAGNYPTGWILQFCEERMPEAAPSAETIKALMRREGRECDSIRTADSELESWRDLFRQMTQSTL